MTHDTSHPFWECESTIDSMRCLAIIIHDYLSANAEIDAARQNALCHLSGSLLAQIGQMQAAWETAFPDHGENA